MMEKNSSYYVHMQDTYFSEKSEIGSFAQISYTPPPNNVFTYDEENTEKTQEIWKASPTKLNECGNDWTVTSTIEATTKTKHVAAAGCEELTPNFEHIGAGS